MCDSCQKTSQFIGRPIDFHTKPPNEDDVKAWLEMHSAARKERKAWRAKAKVMIEAPTLDERAKRFRYIRSCMKIPAREMAILLGIPTVNDISDFECGQKKVPVPILRLLEWEFHDFQRKQRQQVGQPVTSYDEDVKIRVLLELAVGKSADTIAREMILDPEYVNYIALQMEK